MRKDMGELVIGGLLPDPSDLNNVKLQKQLATTILLKEMKCPMLPIKQLEKHRRGFSKAKQCLTAVIDPNAIYGRNENPYNAGKSILMRALEEGQETMAWDLIAKGADVKYSCTDGGAGRFTTILSCFTGVNRLHATARGPSGWENWKARVESIKVVSTDLLNELILRGADCNAKTTTNSPLNCAASMGLSAHVDLLLRHGALPNPGYIQGGSTPLHDARGRETTQLLISAGANLTVKNDLGQTPLEDALLNSKHEKIDVLKTALADPVHILQNALIQIADAHWALQKETPNRQKLNQALMIAMHKMGID